MPFAAKSKLPRLPREYYQGAAVVLWTHTLEHRATGWLDASFHTQFREILLHTCHRYALACPCYVLMPDHWHLVWMGINPCSDQWLATAFLRKHLSAALGSARLQDRAHDHLLREHERERGAFEAACAYVLYNPSRANLCPEWSAWPYLGAIVSGYPDLNPRSAAFWDHYWSIHNGLVAPETVPALTRRATPASCSPLRKQRDNSRDHHRRPPTP